MNRGDNRTSSAAVKLDSEWGLQSLPLPAQLFVVACPSGVSVELDIQICLGPRDGRSGLSVQPQTEFDFGSRVPKELIKTNFL